MHKRQFAWGIDEQAEVRESKPGATEHPTRVYPPKGRAACQHPPGAICTG